MGDPTLLPFSAAALAATAMVAAAALRAWRGWLELRREQLSADGRGMSRNDLAALRRRVRRLEAIAEGADL